MANWKPWTREELAARVAQDIPEGWSVNLGIGIPTLVGNYVPRDREVILHSENGIVGMVRRPPRNISTRGWSTPAASM